LNGDFVEIENAKAGSIEIKSFLTKQTKPVKRRIMVLLQLRIQAGEEASGGIIKSTLGGSMSSIMD